MNNTIQIFIATVLCLLILLTVVQPVLSDAKTDRQIVDKILDVMKLNDHHNSDEEADSGETYAQQLAASLLKHTNLSFLTSAHGGLIHHDGDSAEKTHYTINGSLIHPLASTTKPQIENVPPLARNVYKFTFSTPIHKVNFSPTLSSTVNPQESSTVIVPDLAPPKISDIAAPSKTEKVNTPDLPNMPELQAYQKIIDHLDTIDKANVEVATKNDDTESKEPSMKFLPYALRPIFFNIGQRDGINIQGYQTATNPMPNSIFGYGGPVLEALYNQYQPDEMPPQPHHQYYRSNIPETQYITNPFVIFPGVILQNGKVHVTNPTEAMKSLNSLIEEHSRYNPAGTIVQGPCNGAPVGCLVCSSVEPNSCSGDDGLQGPCWDVCPKNCEARECITCNSQCKI